MWSFNCIICEKQIPIKPKMTERTSFLSCFMCNAIIITATLIIL